MNYFLILAIILLIYMSFWFVLSLIKKRNDLADLAWGLGFVLLAWISFYFGSGETLSLRALLVTAMVTVWGVRLSTHIYLRNKGKEEDYRYKKWRKEWSYFKLRSFFQIYILQGILLYIIVLPALIVNMSPTSGLTLFDGVGLFIWLFGFFFEVLADYQLKRFIQNPETGGIMQKGLWGWSRHPNYFGEVVQWWGIFTISLSVSQTFLIALSPITITVLILKISGVPLLEEKMASRPGFEEYKKRVNKFFPGPSKGK